MKKIVFVLVLLALVGSFAMADDALVLPAKVIRAYGTGAYAMINQAYDADGEAADVANAITVINVGAAVEYGVTDWLSAAVQWAPGYNVYSELDGLSATLADAADLFVGAKVQIVGPKAPVQNDMIRFAVAPGVKFPLGTIDWAAEAAKYPAGEFLAQPADRHTLGAGGRVYFDYVINEMFYLNLYSEFIYYPGKIELKDSSLTGYLTWAGFAINPDVEYGYDLTAEFEPHFEMMIGDGLKLSAGVPVTYTASPETTWDGVGNDDASYLLSVGPNASLFFQKAFLPLELKVGYTLPLMGVLSNATNTIVVQLKAYAKF